MTTKRYRRWYAALLAAALTAALSAVPGLAADTPFAELRIDAADSDIQERVISVNLYRRKDGRFQVDDTVEYTCKLNRVTGDAGLFIQPKADGVWVSVDYLTDLNGDGTYELLDGGGGPVWDVMSPDGSLSQQGSAPALTSGETYILSPDALVQRSRNAVQARSTGGVTRLDVGQGSVVQPDFPLCMIKLHRTDYTTGVDSVQTYYLEIYDQLLVPFDVSSSDWYYDAVRFVLSEGYFSGTEDGLFLPDGQLTRAQLAQVLWTMGGSQYANPAPFSDVPDREWYCRPVSWCHQEGLMAGYDAGTFAPGDPLSREQMISILFRYAQYSGNTPQILNHDLSMFSDADEVSPWAEEPMNWAVSSALLHDLDSLLRPGDPVTRAELAAALYAYELNTHMR